MSAAVLPITPAPAVAPSPTPAGPRPVRWTSDDFYAMRNLPSLQGQKSMLIDGEVLVMPLPSPLSSISHALVEEWLRTVFPPGQFTIRSQLGIYFGINTDPVPDVAVVSGPPRAHARHPRTAHLIVEIADTSLVVDTGDKASLYAAAGITDYWVIDVNERVEPGGSFPAIALKSRIRTIAPLCSCKSVAGSVTIGPVSFLAGRGAVGLIASPPTIWVPPLGH